MSPYVFQAKPSESPDLGRRSFLKKGLACAACLALPLPSFAHTKGPDSRPRNISLYNTHTGERLHSVTYWNDGSYLPESLADINFLLRDHRADAVKPVDTQLLDMLYRLNVKLDNQEPYHIISGYRSPVTNRKLQQSGNGVATKSFHLTGQAVDIRLPGRKLSQLRRAALDLGFGGVGYYPRSNFVHIDTGPRRSW